jgi:hypothetical protein
MKITIVGAAGGEDGPREALAKLIGQRYHLKSELPQMNETLVI